MIDDNLEKILKKNLTCISKSNWKHLQVIYSCGLAETLKEHFGIEILEEIEDILKSKNVTNKEWTQLKKALLPFVSNENKINKTQVQELIEKDSNRHGGSSGPADPDSGGYRAIAQKIREEQG